MKIISKGIILLLMAISTIGCKTTKESRLKSIIVYKSSNLIIKQISKNSFVHISYLQTDDFGNVPCNGLIVRDNDEVIIYDTPTTYKSAEELIKWIQQTLSCQIKAIIPTHFHHDCLGDLKIFHDNNIPSFGYIKTIEFAKAQNLITPINSFPDSLILKVGNKIAITKFFGEGHTKDNVVGYFPSENILFGGCLLKAIDANKGYLGDANLLEWSNTVEKVKVAFPDVKMVIPGHGNYGNSKLLDYTIHLFKVQNNKM